MRYNLEEQRKNVELDMYDLTLKRQRIRTYVQSMQRDTLQQKEDYDLMLEEERDKIKVATHMVEETLLMKNETMLHTRKYNNQLLQN